MTPTLVLPPRFSSDSILLWKAAIDQGWEVERLTSWRVPEGLPRQNLALYGEPLFAAVVAPQLGIALLGPTPDWLPSLPERLLQRKVRLSTLAGARGLARSLFIKPPYEKSFPAGVYDSGEEIPGTAGLSGETVVLVSEPVEWEIEFRFFVLERRIAAHSAYLRRGELARDPSGAWIANNAAETEALHFVSGFLADPGIPLPPSVAVDVGSIAGRGWAVVEANASWASGIYGCDPRAVLEVVRRACFERGAVPEAAWRWIVE